MQSLSFFFRLFYWFSLRHMRKHRGRALTVLLGVALGAAVFTSVRLSIHACLSSFSQSMDLIAGQADWTLVRPGGRVPQDLMAQLLKSPLIRYASPVMSSYVQIDSRDADPFLLIGFDPILDRPFRSWQMDASQAKGADAWLELLKTPYTLIIGEQLGRDHGLDPGDFITLNHVGRRDRFQILGNLASQGLALLEGGRVALTDIATFQEFTGIFEVVDRIDLALKPGIPATGLQQLRSLLPEGVFLQAATETRQNGREMIRAYQLNLSVLSFVSLFVGMFLVYSLVALNAASRRNELAILRSIGASARSLFQLFLAEAALFGLTGWLAAIPLTSLMVKYLLHGVSQTISNLFVRVQVTQLNLNGWELGLSLGMTVVVSILAAVQPAREAMRVAPREALYALLPARTSAASAYRLARIGALLIILVWPLSQLPGIGALPLPGYLATFLLFSGFALLAPWVLHGLGSYLPPLLVRVAGLPAYLAGRYMRDSGARAAISVGALITAVALFSALVIMVHSFRKTVELWTQQTVSGDLYTAAKMADINAYRDTVPAEIADALQHLDAPVDKVAYRRFYLQYQGIPFQFEAIDFEPFFRHGGYFWLAGDPTHVRARLKRGEGVIVSEVFTNRTGLSTGERFRTTIQTAAVDLPILGVIRDYRTQGGVVFYSLPHFQTRFNEPGISGMRFFFRDRDQNLETAVARLRTQIIACCGDSLGMISGGDLRQAILRIFDETFAITTVLLLIALLVAALGITTTLTVLVLERSRQLNTLYAVGATFGQIRAMIFWEAALLVIVGECGGLLCGLALSHLLVFVINRQSFGWTFLYTIDWGSLALSLPLIFITALLAALPATRIVFRQSPATLLRER